MRIIKRASAFMTLWVLIMLPTFIISKYEVMRGANMSLFNFHYQMWKEGIPLRLNDSYSISFDKGLDSTPYLGMAKGMFYINKVDIRINKKMWKELDENDRKILLYHEMAHDLLMQRHITDPNSIMYPNRMGMNRRDADSMLTEFLQYYKYRHGKDKKQQR